MKQNGLLSDKKIGDIKRRIKKHLSPMKREKDINKRDKKIRQRLLHPEVFEENDFKLASTRGMNPTKEEAKLYQRAEEHRFTLLALYQISAFLEDPVSPQLAKEITESLIDHNERKLDKLNRQRLASCIVDATARKAALAPEKSMLHDKESLAILKNSKKIEGLLAKKKPATQVIYREVERKDDKRSFETPQRKQTEHAHQASSSVGTAAAGGAKEATAQHDNPVKRGDNRDKQSGGGRRKN